VDRLFSWYFAGDTEIHVPGSPPLRVSRASARLLEEAMETGGAMVTGRRNFDIAQAWGGHPPTAPCFVLTHQPPQEWVSDGSPFVFVTDGICHDGHQCATGSRRDTLRRSERGTAQHVARFQAEGCPTIHQPARLIEWGTFTA
jgi:hypothetical protein